VTGNSKIARSQSSSLASEAVAQSRREVQKAHPDMPPPSNFGRENSASGDGRRGSKSRSHDSNSQAGSDLLYGSYLTPTSHRAGSPDRSGYTCLQICTFYRYICIYCVFLVCMYVYIYIYVYSYMYGSYLTPPSHQTGSPDRSWYVCMYTHMSTRINNFYIHEFFTCMYMYIIK
jgi:hypothetical protein